MKSQREEIVRHLKAGKSITPLIALERFGCFRLSGRILEIRQAGLNVQTTMVEYKGKRFAEYRLAQ